MGDIGRIAGDIIMVIYLNIHSLQTIAKGLCHTLSGETGQHHAGYIQTKATEHVNQPNHIPVVCNAQIAPDFIFLNIIGIDGNNHLHLLLQL